MDKLKQIYNPVSDTFLILEDTGKRERRYHCYRQSRFVDDLPERSSKKLKPFTTPSLQTAEEVFTERARHEGHLWMQQLVGDIYVRKGDYSWAAKGKKLCDAFMNAAYIKYVGPIDYHYAVCDSGAQRLYSFENEYFDANPPVMISKQTTEKLAGKIAKRYGFETPCFHYSDEDIYYAPAGRNVRGLANVDSYPYEVTLKTYGGKIEKRIFLHEMAHLVTHQSFGWVISHGPHFALAATHLYERHMGLEQDRYFGLANDPKYRVFGPEAVDPQDVLGADFKREDDDLWKGILRNTPLADPSPVYSLAAQLQALASFARHML